MGPSRATAASVIAAVAALLLVGSLDARIGATGAAAVPGSQAQAQPSPPQGQPPPQGQQGQQAQPPQQPTFRAGVRLVRVDVTVIGNGDKGVPDLTAADFEVAEDNVPQKVETVQFVRLSGRPGASDETNLEIRSRDHAAAEAAREDIRLFVIFLDDYHIEKLPAITIPLRRELTTFINRLQPTDLVAIVDPLTLASHIEFTRSQADLLDIVRNFEGRMFEIFPVKNAAEEAQLKSGDPLRLRAQVTYSALQSICVRLGGIREGRKTVIFVSEGPPIMLPTGNLELDIRGVTDAANRANVTIHTVDPRGLGAYTRAADSLYRLANDTGGRAILNTNNFELGLRQVVEDASSYYLVGYAPTRSEDDGKFHKISVKVKRPGVRVIHRSGYWAPSRKELDAAADAAAKPRDPGVTGAIRTLARSEPRGTVQAWVGFSKAPDGGTLATIGWEPAVPATEPAVASLELEVVRAGTKTATNPTLTLPAAGPGQPRPQVSLPVQPGDVLVRFSARTQDGVIVDRWEQPIAVPNLATAPLALATTRFYVASSLPELRELQKDPNPAPRALRTFRQTDRVFAEVQVYWAGGAEGLAVGAELLSAEGKGIVSFPITELAGGRARFELPVRNLGKGTYLLRVRSKLGDVQVEDVTAFKVTP
jgi:VWFA-related protein